MANWFLTTMWCLVKAIFTGIYGMTWIITGTLYKDLPHHGKPYKMKMSSYDEVKIKSRVDIEQRHAILTKRSSLII
ncbi:hypothetical protein [Candidatus Enterovibrio escicola]|uniref:hypothetical protein n=2 Tax=Candidatus Enterovibrio escicola TaxID=1927127 RepID=UPI001237F478|nr:hypothetical protein [Candidatus Enterovibrio escacola]